MGSGSTDVACMNTNRNFIRIEIDTNYYEIANDILNKANKQNKLL
jgi:DNA modification methylase